MSQFTRGIAYRRPSSMLHWPGNSASGTCFSRNVLFFCCHFYAASCTDLHGSRDRRATMIYGNARHGGTHDFSLRADAGFAMVWVGPEAVSRRHWKRPSREAIMARSDRLWSQWPRTAERAGFATDCNGLPVAH